jgi:hypothetical protein
VNRKEDLLLTGRRLLRRSGDIIDYLHCSWHIWGWSIMKWPYYTHLRLLAYDLFYHTEWLPWFLERWSDLYMFLCRSMRIDKDAPVDLFGTHQVRPTPQFCIVHLYPKFLNLS